MKDNIKVSGHITIKLFRDGLLIDKREVNNLITNAGLAALSSRLNGADSEAAFTYLAVGTGTTAANASDTTLETEITDSGLARVAATCTRVTTTETDDTAQLTYSWTATGSKAITECGALNAATNGVLLGRQVFDSSVGVSNGDTFAVTYKFKFS